MKFELSEGLKHFDPSSHADLQERSIKVLNLAGGLSY